MTTDADPDPALGRIPTRRRTGRPAEIARIVTAGTSGVVAFGLVGYFGLTERQATPNPVFAPTAATSPATGSLPPSTSAPAPVPVATVSSVPLTTILGGAVATPSPPTPVPVPVPTPAAPAVAAAPPPVNVVSEQSR